MIHSCKINMDFDIDPKDFSYDAELKDILSYQHRHTSIRPILRMNAWGRQNSTRIEGAWGRTIVPSTKLKEDKVEKSHPIFDNAPTSKSSIQDIFSKVFAHNMSHNN